MGSTSERTPFVATQLAGVYDKVGTLPVQVILHDVRSLYNVGAFFRTADAVRLEQLCLAGITGYPPHRELAKTALGAQDHVRWIRCSDPLEYIETLRDLEFEVAAVETSPTAVDLFDWQPRFPVALLFGHEVNGLDEALLAVCDTHVRLPMRGVKHSLNVATAGGVVLYELLRKYRGLCDPADRPPDQL
jgi:tRNA G18 (ribose-2'-O)-methylase SpoU